MNDTADLARPLYDEEKQKLLADAEAARAAAEASRAAAEASRSTAAMNDMQASKWAAEAEFAKIQLAREEFKHGLELAGNEFHHVYHFVGSVGAESVAKAMRQLTVWLRQDAGKDDKANIEIVFSSPGGSIVDGMALWDYIQQVRNAGHHVTTSTIGMAASMAGILLQAGDTRVMGKEAWLLIHEASFGAGGKIGEVEDTVEWIKKVQQRIVDIFINRSDGKLSKATLTKNWRRTDWWISSEEALKLGLVDEVR